MPDTEYLCWLRERLVHVYKESRNVDFVKKLERIILNLKEAHWEEKS